MPSPSPRPASGSARSTSAGSTLSDSDQRTVERAGVVTALVLLFERQAADARQSAAQPPRQRPRRARGSREERLTLARAVGFDPQRALLPARAPRRRADRPPGPAHLRAAPPPARPRSSAPTTATSSPSCPGTDAGRPGPSAVAARIGKRTCVTVAGVGPVDRRRRRCPRRPRGGAPHGRRPHRARPPGQGRRGDPARLRRSHRGLRRPTSTSTSASSSAPSSTTTSARGTDLVGTARGLLRRGWQPAPRRGHAARARQHRLAAARAHRGPARGDAGSSRTTRSSCRSRCACAPSSAAPDAVRGPGRAGARSSVDEPPVDGVGDGGDAHVAEDDVVVVGVDSGRRDSRPATARAASVTRRRAPAARRAVPARPRRARPGTPCATAARRPAWVSAVGHDVGTVGAHGVEDARAVPLPVRGRRSRGRARCRPARHRRRVRRSTGPRAGCPDQKSRYAAGSAKRIDSRSMAGPITDVQGGVDVEVVGHAGRRGPRRRARPPANRSGCRAAASAAMKAPIEWPTRTGRRAEHGRRSEVRSSTCAPRPYGPGADRLSPRPRRSGARKRTPPGPCRRPHLVGDPAPATDRWP